MIDILKQDMINTYRKIGKNQGLLIRGKYCYTGDEIADEIEKESTFGISIVNMLINLTIDLVRRQKLNVNE